MYKVKVVDMSPNATDNVEDVSGSPDPDRGRDGQDGHGDGRGAFKGSPLTFAPPKISRPNIMLRLLEVARQDVHRFPTASSHDGSRIVAHA